MKILRESDVVSQYDKAETVAMLRKAGKLNYVDTSEDSVEMLDYIFQYQEMKKLGIPKSKILSMFISADGPDQLGELVASQYENTRKYANLYPNDYTIPYNRDRLAKSRGKR